MELNKIKNIIIHIGYPKTGTTWFKKYFYSNIENATTLYIDDFTYNISENKSHFELNNNLPELKENLIIVSHKFTGLENFKWDDGIYRTFFISNLKRLFPNALIVLFIRNQIDFIASSYSSYLTHGGTYTFQKLFKTGKLGDGKMFSFEFLNYHTLIKLYKEQFGENNVHIFLYEEFLENNKIFLNNYSKTFNLDIDINSINFIKYNEKLRKHLASFIRFSNFFSKKGVQPKKYIINTPWLFSWLNLKSTKKINKNKILGKSLNNNDILGNELTNYINNYYKPSNNMLINEMGLNQIRKYNYPL